MHDSLKMRAWGKITKGAALLSALCVLAAITAACGKQAEKPRTKTFLSVEKPIKVSNLILPSLVMNSKRHLLMSLFIHSTFPSATETVDAIAILKSVDDGATWEEVGRIRSHLTYGAWGYDLAIDARDNLYITWVTALRKNPSPAPFKAIMYSRSNDGGRTWTSALRVSTPTTGQRRNPVIGVSGNDIHIAWLDRPQSSSGGRGRGKIEDVYIASSVDGGATWADSVCVEANLQNKITSSGAPSLLVTPNGTVYCAYFSMRRRPKKKPLAGAWIAISTNKGRSFATNLVPADVLGDVSLTEADGLLYLAAVHVISIKRLSMQNPQTNQEVNFYTSSDNGTSWSGPVRIDDDPTHQHKNNLRLASLGHGRLVACWHDNRGGVYMAISPDSGKTWGINLKVAALSHIAITPLDIAADTSAGVFYLATSDIHKGRGDTTHITKGRGTF